MKANLLPISILAAAAAVLLSGPAFADNKGSVADAFKVARGAVSPDIQNKVVSLYGIGTPNTIQKWYVIFYDPSVESHGRAVLVENGAVTKTYPANGGTVYSGALAFDPSKITSDGPALAAAQDYAAKHSIPYDGVHALLKQTNANKPFRWRIELLDVGKSKGYVYVNAIDDTVAYYQAPKGGKSSGSDDTTVEGFASDVKNTFLGVGGDLEEFFTGQRTVDK